MANRDEETIELESQPLNAEKKAEILASTKADQQKEKLTPIGLTKEELMKYAKDPFWCKLRKILFALFWLLWLSMFVGAFLIIHYVPSCPATSRLKWYQKESTAQIDLNKVFKNKFSMISDPNNIGPFMNVFQAKTLLLPNIFNSTENNEILDHLQLNTRFGSQEELSKAIQNLKVNHQTNVIADLDAATTSQDHPWFTAFMARQDKYANYYLIADANYVGYINYGTRKLPDGRGHLITKYGRPVLNLLSPDVRAEFRAIFEKWGRLNIKGYRLLGAPFILLDPVTKQTVKSVELNQKLIKEWTKELRQVVSDGVLILQLDDQDAESYAQYFGTQSDPIADIVVNKFVSRLDISNSTGAIRSKLQEYINQTKPWNDDLNNIGPWTGWLTDDLNESRNKDDLIICFSNILGYILPRGMPLTRISSNLLHIGIPEVFFQTLREEFNNIEKYGTFDNARIFSKLSNLRMAYADAIMLGKTEFADVRVNGRLNDDVFTMIRMNDKQGLILIANLKNGSKNITLDLDFSRYPRSADVAASCRIKEGHLIGAKLSLDQPINLKLNETLIATFDFAN